MFGVGFAFKHDDKLIYPTMGMKVQIVRNNRDWKTNYAFDIFSTIWDLEIWFRVYNLWYCKIGALIDPNIFKLKTTSSRKKDIYISCCLMAYELKFVARSDSRTSDVVDTNGEKYLWSPNEFYTTFQPYNPQFWDQWKQRRLVLSKQTCRKVQTCRKATNKSNNNKTNSNTTKRNSSNNNTSN